MTRLYRIFVILYTVFLFFACSDNTSKAEPAAPVRSGPSSSPGSVISSMPGIIGGISPPPGFTRVPYPEQSFMSWLRNLPLRRDYRILAFTGREIERNYQIFAVADMPLLFKSDLEQCADFCMRFWAEYHRAAGLLGSLYLFEYGGGKVYYTGSGTDNAAFSGFLRHAFAYSNSFSLLKGCTPVSDDEARPGDMFVQNETGGIGHVSMIVDACENSLGDRLFLVGFSFMPAQEFHIEKAANAYGKAGWFSLEGYKNFLAEYYNYGTPYMRRF